MLSNPRWSQISAIATYTPTGACDGQPTTRLCHTKECDTLDSPCRNYNDIQVYCDGVHTYCPSAGVECTSFTNALDGTNCTTSGGDPGWCDNGGCVSSCVPTRGESCGLCGGNITCSGSCSIPTPTNYNQPCPCDVLSNPPRIKGCDNACDIPYLSKSPCVTRVGYCDECHTKWACFPIGNPTEVRCDSPQEYGTECANGYGVYKCDCAGISSDQPCNLYCNATANIRHTMDGEIGYCDSSSKCLSYITGLSGPGNYSCVENGYYQNDDYCEYGTWTTRTKLNSK